jgi:hypothetical protein
MATRRPLTEGLKQPAPPIDTGIEKEFVFRQSSSAPPATSQKAPSVDHQAPGSSMSRVPISTRMRSDFATALKRASLERQLNGTTPNTLQDILEEAVQPWLREHGYLT